MSTLRNIAILTISGSLLAACTGPDIDMLAKMPNKGTAFDSGLHAGYTELAKIEAAEYDFADADHFGKKAMMAANGENVLPDRLYERKVPEKYISELEPAWQQLTLPAHMAARKRRPRRWQRPRPSSIAGYRKLKKIFSVSISRVARSVSTRRWPR